MQVGLGLLNVGGVQRIVDLRQHRSFIDHRTVIDRLAVDILAERVDLPGDLGSDIHDFFRLDRPGRADRGQQVSAL